MSQLAFASAGSRESVLAGAIALNPVSAYVDENKTSGNISFTTSEKNNIEKKLAAYRLRILFFAFLTKSKVKTLKNNI